MYSNSNTPTGLQKTQGSVPRTHTKAVDREVDRRALRTVGQTWERASTKRLENKMAKGTCTNRTTRNRPRWSTNSSRRHSTRQTSAPAPCWSSKGWERYTNTGLYRKNRTSKVPVHSKGAWSGFGPMWMWKGSGDSSTHGFILYKRGRAPLTPSNE